MKDVEIGTFGETKVYMKLDELFRIANKEVQDFADKVCVDNSKLQYQLEQAIEALKFYADESHYKKECIDSNVGAIEEIIIDKGRIARNTLQECGL